MAQAIATLRSLAELLGLCSSCKHRLTADEHPPEPSQRPRRDANVRCTRSTLTDVSFTDTELIDVKVIDCRWKNVAFIDCQLSHVVFDRVELKDVRFYNIDFRRVRLTSLDVEYTVWSDMFIDQGLISMGHSNEAVGTYEVPVLGCSSLSRTKAGESSPKVVVDPQPLNIVFHASPLRTSHLVPKNPRTLLRLPSLILEKIMSELYPRHRFIVCDVPLEEAVGLETKQTTYETTQGARRGRTTYEVSQLTAKAKLCTAFLRVSKACYQLGVTYLYDHSFAFYGSAESCLAFLHDHRRVEHKFVELGIFFHLRGGNGNTPTDLLAWRRLFNVLVHERADLDMVTLLVLGGFWETAPWQSGVEAVMAQPNLCRPASGNQDLDDPRNFLEHVARLPATLEGSRRNGRIHFYLEIVGSHEEPEKAAFRSALGSHMLEAYMLQRPQLAQPRYGSCTGTRQLERSCYWKQPGKDREMC